MPRVLVYFDSPPNQKAVIFAASRCSTDGREVEIIAVDEGGEALVALDEGPWDLAVIGFVAGESVVEAFARARVPTLVGICVDEPAHEAEARSQGATKCCVWPAQAKTWIAMIRELLG